MKQNYIIKKEFNRLELLDARFYMTKDGEKFPSVTTILDAYPKGPQFYEWLKTQGNNADEILEEAGRLGSVVHGLTEEYDLGNEVSLLNAVGEPQYKLSDWNFFERYVEFRERFDADILFTELNLCSSELKFGGTLDRIIRLNGRNILLDIKTSNYIHNHFWLQLAAYDQLFAEFYPDVKIDDTAILHLKAKTRTEGKGDAIQGKGWQLLFSPKSRTHYWNLFKSVQKTWIEEFGDMVPKQTYYNLTHKVGEKKIATQPPKMGLAEIKPSSLLKKIETNGTGK